jgi:hypothetical protein
MPFFGFFEVWFEPCFPEFYLKMGPQKMARLIAILLLVLCSSIGCAAKKAPNTPNTLGCGMRHCSAALIGCTFDRACRDTLACNRRCSELAEDTAGEQACHLLCQVEEGLGSKSYRKVVQCFADNTCLPRAEEGRDGVCPVNQDTMASTVAVESLADLQGTWREVRGRNCGRPDSNWQGGYDALECRSSSWVLHDGEIWYHTSFAGTAGRQGTLPYLIAEPAVASDGGLDVHYKNPPLTPQVERWYVLSRPTDDWMAYTYCGHTPAGTYAGVNVITRTDVQSGDAIPNTVVESMREDLGRFGLSWEKFCSVDHTGCTAPQAEPDLLESLLESSK